MNRGDSWPFDEGLEKLAPILRGDPRESASDVVHRAWFVEWSPTVRLTVTGRARRSSTDELANVSVRQWPIALEPRSPHL